MAEVFTGSPGKLVSLADTIKGFKGLVEGKYDHLPEAAFYMVGTIEEAHREGAEARQGGVSRSSMARRDPAAPSVKDRQMATFPFELVSPERLLFAGEVEDVVVPGVEGEFTVLKDHAPLMTTLKPGIVDDRRDAAASARGSSCAAASPTSPRPGSRSWPKPATPVEEFDAAKLEIELQDAQESLAAAKTEDSRQLAAERVDQLKALQMSAARLAAHARSRSAWLSEPCDQVARASAARDPPPPWSVVPIWMKPAIFSWSARPNCASTRRS